VQTPEVHGDLQQQHHEPKRKPVLSIVAEVPEQALSYATNDLMKGTCLSGRFLDALRCRRPH
jgi:hypothetical protein